MTTLSRVADLMAIDGGLSFIKSWKIVVGALLKADKNFLHAHDQLESRNLILSQLNGREVDDAEI